MEPINSSLFIESTNSIDRLTEIKNSWQNLLLNSATTNPFYECWSLQAAIRHMGESNICIVLVWLDNKKQQLLGLFPLERKNTYKRFPLTQLCTFKHIFCYLTTPLVDRERLPEVILAFLAWSKQQTVSVLTFNHIYCDDFYTKLISILKSSNYAFNISNLHQRALLYSDLSGDEYLRTYINKKRRKEFKRLYSRLAERGHIEIDSIDVNKEPEEWLDAFLALEKSGWKGKQESAILNNVKHHSYIKDMFYSAASEKRLFCTHLCLDNVMIAGLIVLVSGKSAYAFKTTYDESYEQYSPGTLLMIETTKILLDSNIVIQVDSCATQDHPMINRIWKQRIDISTLEICLNKPFGKILFKFILSLKQIRKNLQKR